LGDGGLTTDSPSLTDLDDEILNRVKQSLPDDYKFGSIEQRLELLQGLLDTDGDIFKNGSHIEITLASKQLINDLQFIVQSLGGIGRIKDKWVTYKGERRKYYRMAIKLPPQFIPFKLKRKIDRYKPVSKYLPAKGISKIEYVGKEEAQCIAVDASDHLYVTDHCIVTHNTLCSIGYAEMMGFKKILVITPNSLKYNYRDEVDKFTLGKKAHILSGKPVAKKNTSKIQKERDDANYLIVNYDYFNPKDFKKVQSKFNALNLGFIECVVMDESHMIKNTSSNTYKNIKKL
jgi:intein/homing endonuclease